MSERRLSPVWTFADGHLLGGHRLLRRHKDDSTPRENDWMKPAGMTTFIVNNDEIVYQIYNPNPSWHRTDDEWPQDVAAADH